MRAVALKNPLLPALLLCGAPVLAAGGHHAVDDAAMVEPGQCQVETWREYEHGRTLLHEGPACRLGAFEVGVNLDQLRAPTAHRHGEGLQLKYATSSEGPLNVAVVAGTYRWSNPRLSVFSLLLPLTWQPTPAWAVHLNWGRNWNHGAQATPQKGVALEWTANPQWQFTGEWFNVGAAYYRRAGARYVLSDAWTLDMSYATSRGTPWWTTGVTWTFDR